MKPSVVPSYCRICVAACGILVEVDGDDVLAVRGDPDHPITGGYTCPKGRALAADHRDPSRLDGPLIRLGDRLVPVGWDDVLDDLAARLGSIVDDAGPDAVAAYLGSQVQLDSAGRGTAERLVGALGTHSIYTSMTTDCPSKPLVAHLMFGHARLLSLGDLASTKLMLVLGANPVVSHGHTWAMSDPVRTLREVAQRGHLWVVDPRRTETARLAQHHLAPRPGTDHHLLAYLVREVLAEGGDRPYLRDYTVGVNELSAAVAPFDRSFVASSTGIAEAVLDELVADICRVGRIVVQTGTGTTMGASANAVEWLALALAAVTGSIDRPGGMWFNPGVLNRLDEQGLGPPTPATAEPGPTSRPDLPRRMGQFPVAGLLDELESGNIRALVSVGGNLVASAPQPDRFIEATRRLGVFAVTEIADSATMRLATHVLACTGQLERADATNRTEVLFPAVGGQHTAAVVRPFAERRPMWWVFAQLGHRLGLQVLPPGIDLARATDEDVLDGLIGVDRLALLRGHPHGYVEEGGIRWGWVVGTDQLPGGRIQLAPPELVRSLVTGVPASGLVLAPRRQLRHLNSQFLPGARQDSPDVLLSPTDADARGITSGQAVLVTSPHGQVRGTAVVDDGLAAGYVSIPHGFTAEGTPNVGALVSNDANIDLLSGMTLQAGVALEVALA
jgi:anaerobic selenocysteine-containing dehydrogenase